MGLSLKLLAIPAEQLRNQEDSDHTQQIHVDVKAHGDIEDDQIEGTRSESEGKVLHEELMGRAPFRKEEPDRLTEDASHDDTEKEDEGHDPQSSTRQDPTCLSAGANGPTSLLRTAFPPTVVLPAAQGSTHRCCPAHGSDPAGANGPLANQ